MADVAPGSEGFCAAVVPVESTLAGSAVAADELAELAVDFGGLLDAVVEHGAPFFCVVVEGDGAEEEAGLEDDFEGVAEVVGEAPDFFGLLLGNRLGLQRCGHEEVPILKGNACLGA